MANKNFVEKHSMSLIIVSLVVAAGIAFIILNPSINPFSQENNQNYAYQDRELCMGISSQDDIMSCMEAVDYTLKGYPGKVTFVDKATLNIPTTIDGAGNETEEKTGWLVRIDLTTPLADSDGNSIKTVELFIDTEGEIMLYRFWK